MGENFKATLFSAFKMRGLSLRNDARKYLADIFRHINEVERENWIDVLLDEIDKRSLTSNIIDTEILQSVIHEGITVGTSQDKLLTIINAFDVPRYSYDVEKKRFVDYTKDDVNSSTVLTPASHRAKVFQERYNLLLQRTLRHELFVPSVGIPDTNSESKKKFQLRNTEYLLGCASKAKDIIILGMLTQIKEGKYFLEDLTGAVEINLSNAKFHAGLFTESCFVLAEGYYVDGIFHVSALGLPPHETAPTTRAYYGNFNFFGGRSNRSAESINRLKKIEKDRKDAKFVILCDVWLDQEDVLNRLEKMFRQFDATPPTCFIFCGKFMSKSFTKDQSAGLGDVLDNFMNILLSFPKLCSQSAFIFVPSLEDIGPAKILPRPALPQILTDEFCRKLPNVSFSSNPCRIQYCSQDIVIFCENIMHKMVQNCLKYPSGHIPTHFVKTVVSQAHLCPIPVEILPVYWQNDQSLWLYPLPDLIIFADRQAQSFQESIEGSCIIANPASFSSANYCYKVYFPSSGVMQDNKIE